MLAALSVKSTGCVGSIIRYVTVTGLNVPGVNAGMFTIAFVGVPTTVKDCKPVPALTWSIVTEFIPVVMPKDTMPPGAKSPSVTVEVGVHVLRLQRTLMNAAWNVLAALKVKSTAISELVVVKVTVTGSNVPGVNAGILTVALVGIPTIVKDCKPVPALTWSTVTEPTPLVTPKETIPPGNKSPSVTVVVGLQGGCGVGVAVGVTVGVGVAVGDGLGVGVAVGVGVGVGVTKQLPKRVKIVEVENGTEEELPDAKS